MMTVAIFAVLIGLMMIGVPIAVSMGLTAALFFVILGEPEHLLMVPARMYSSTTGFTLLAIPFFILAGNLMNTGGMTIRLFQFCQNLVGHIRGGLGHVNVVANIIVAGMSGSAIADAAGVGLVAMNAMSKAGFDRAFSAGVSAAAATIGPIIPPSIPLVIFGCMTGVSVGRLFLGGFAPGLLMGLGLMITVYITSVRRGYPTQPRASFKAVLASLRGAWSAILAPDHRGRRHPHRRVHAHRSLGGRVLLRGRHQHFPLPRSQSKTAHGDPGGDRRPDGARAVHHCGRRAVRLAADPAAGAGSRHPVPAVPEPQTRIVMLLIINVILLVLGCFMEAISIMLLTIPIFMPLVAKVGIDPVHFGVMMTFNLMVALLTPPVGMVLYTVSCVGQVPLWKLASELKWHIVALMVCLFLITYIPGIVTWIPNLVMG